MRAPAEIARLLDLRADRAIAHVTRLSRHGTPRTCPICGYHGPFSPVRHKLETWCPGCDSRPRHRLMRLWLDRHAAVGPGTRVLHFAAEPWVRAWMAERGAAYVTADLNDRFDLVLDITAIALADASQDLVIANHVLEHVDDARALGELRRILAPGGTALLTLPVIEGWETTLELPDLDAGARALHYGDADHRRFYGRDIRDRIRAAGLALTEYTAPWDDIAAHGLNRGERLFLARA